MSLLELSTFHAASPLFQFVARGDGHPVLVLPGLVGPDHSTLPLRQLLRLRGHDAHGWLLGRNFGAHQHVMGGMYDRLEQLFESSGQTVSLVGWSLGGIFARELARDRPRWCARSSPCARRSASGTAIAAMPRRSTTSSAPRVEPFVGRTAGARAAADPGAGHGDLHAHRRDRPVALLHRGRRPAPGERRGARDAHGDGRQHAGDDRVADRLAQPEGRWRRFRPPLMLRAWYPRALTWRPTVSSRPTTACLQANSPG